MKAFKWVGTGGTYTALDGDRLIATVSRFQKINQKSIQSYISYWWIAHHKGTGEINEVYKLSDEQREHISLEAATRFVEKLYEKE